MFNPTHLHGATLPHGVFLNHPGWGAVDMTNKTSTVWSVAMGRQLDLWVSTRPVPLGTVRRAPQQRSTDQIDDS